MKTSVTLLLLLGALTNLPLAGQNADTLIAAGRAALVNRDLATASADFNAAVAAAPGNPTANVLAAMARVLAFPGRPESSALLDRFGFAPTNRSIYHWTATLGHDTNGIPLTSRALNAMEASDFLRTNLLAEAAAAQANLAKVSDPQFTLTLASNETARAEVTLDYGDVLLMQAGLGFAQYFGHTLTSWNLDAQFGAVLNLVTNDTTPEGLLSLYPNLFTFHNTNELAAAQQAFSHAADLYLAASAFIRSRPTNVTRLFNYDADMAKAEQAIRTTITDLKASLSGPVVLQVRPDLTVDLARQFTGRVSPREFFPELAANRFVAGTVPDPTFDGLIQGVPSHRVDSFLNDPSNKHKHSAHLLVSQLTIPVRLPDGSLQLRVDALNGAFFTVQVSTDLRTWTDWATATVRAGTITVMDQAAQSSPRRFYRALDRSRFIAVTGRIYDGSNGNPVPNAPVQLYLPNITNGLVTIAQTDAQGRFQALTQFQSDYIGNYHLQIAAAGFLPFTQDYYGYSGPQDSVEVYLAPPNFHPANDGFAQRQQLAGTNLTLTAFNVGATREPNDPSPSGFSVWFTWTAPYDGALSIDTSASSITAFVGVYTGTSLIDLQQMMTFNGSMSFFVAKGTTYQIMVDSNYGAPGRIVLQLQRVTPLAPTIRDQASSQTIVAGHSADFWVDADGTFPIHFQWFKDKEPIQDASDAGYYWLQSAGSSDAGSYTVRVTNQAGSALSDPMILDVMGPQGQFFPIGQLPGGSSSQVRAASADGSIAVGNAVDANGFYQSVIWKRDSGLSILPSLPNTSKSPVFMSASDITPDGSIIAGRSFDGSSSSRQPVLWYNGGTLAVGLGTLVPPNTHHIGNAGALSADGSVVYGWATSAKPDVSQEIFRWTPSGGLVALGVLRPGLDNFAFLAGRGTSADGSVAIGYSEYVDTTGTNYVDTAFRYTLQGGMQSLGSLPGGTNSYACAISADGRVIAGVSESAQGIQLFTWTTNSGMIALGIPSGYDSIDATLMGISADGGTIAFTAYVDNSDGTYVSQGFLWHNGSTTSIDQIFQAAGVDEQGLTQVSLAGISPDQAILYGTAIAANGNQEGWVAQLNRGALTDAALATAAVAVQPRPSTTRSESIPGARARLLRAHIPRTER